MKNIKVFFLLIMFLCFMNNVNAICDSRTQLEINTASSNVTADYGVELRVIDWDGVEHPEIPREKTQDINSGYVEKSFVTLNVSNITDKIYFEIINEDDVLDSVYYADDLEDGKFSYAVPDTLKIRNYKIKIFSNVDECKDEELRTINITTPMYNEYSAIQFCENNDIYYCKKYVTSPLPTDIEEIIAKATKAANNGENSKNSKINIFLIIGIIIAILLIGGIIFLLIKRSKDKKFMRENV